MQSTSSPSERDILAAPTTRPTHNPRQPGAVDPILVDLCMEIQTKIRPDKINLKVNAAIKFINAGLQPSGNNPDPHP